MAGIYIHIPFCKQACHYCDFHFSTNLKYKDRLVNALLLELDQKSDLNLTIETIYFGGGTPSLLSANELNLLFDRLYAKYDCSQIKEITLECNPDDLSTEKLGALRKIGINRLSIGVQSFHDEDLKQMNRAHDASMSMSSIIEAKAMGFENITIDLIYGSPTTTDDMWMHNLETVINLDVPHVSSYALTVEPNTALAHFIHKGTFPKLDDQKSLRQFRMMCHYFHENSIQQYEISNFSKLGFEAIHNSNYWKGKAYLGIGPSAHSYDGHQQRSWNIANNAKYMKALEDSNEYCTIEHLTTDNRYNEYILTNLRTRWGIDEKYVQSNFYKNLTTFEQVKEQELKKGNIQYNNIGQLVLTDKGKFIADHIIGEFFVI